ncbi:MAG TPA: hypothetical protein VG722_00865 [Tepidisphaeraceae bacterium]|nr:hypothetical protein [Tepidisphaeraceae bacterium]
MITSLFDRLFIRMSVTLLLLGMIQLARADEKTMRFTMLSVRDPGINNTEAVRFLIPSGWKTQGGVIWMMDHWVQASLSMRISNPNGSESITFLPADTWMNSRQIRTFFRPGQRYMGSVVGALPDNIPNVITQVIVPNARPELREAKIVGTQDLPAMANAILQANQEQGLQKTARAGRVRFEYEENGTTYQEDIYAVVIYTPMPAIGAMSYYLERAYCVRAEKGKLDAMNPILGVMLTSARIGEDWLAGYLYVQQLRNQGIQQNQQAIMRLSQHLAQNAEEMRQMNRQAYEAHQASEDRIFHAISQSIRGVEDYTIPGESTRIELPTGYDHAFYSKSSNEYIVTNDPNYNPNQQTNQSWETLEPAR